MFGLQTRNKPSQESAVDGRTIVKLLERILSNRDNDDIGVLRLHWGEPSNFPVAQEIVGARQYAHVIDHHGRGKSREKCDNGKRKGRQKYAVAAERADECGNAIHSEGPPIDRSGIDGLFSHARAIALLPVVRTPRLPSRSCAWNRLRGLPAHREGESRLRRR